MSLDTIGSRGVFKPHYSQLKIAARALEEIFRGKKPADAILRELFEHHRNAGSRDRAIVSDLVYGVLRNYFPLRAMLGESASPLEWCVAQALHSAMALPRLEQLDMAQLAQRVQAFAAAQLSTADRHNLPDWLWRKLCGQYGEREASALAQALNRSAPVDLRVNRLKATRESAQKRLADEGIASEPTALSPLGLRLQKRAALQRTAAFRQGLIEPQDEGSQLLASFVEPRPGEIIADFCAGAGGKTLALGAQMKDRGQLLAFDTDRTRLSRLQPRLQRSGLSIVQAQPLRTGGDAELKPWIGRCDAVLVDAPCSATGRLRRNPELRLRTPDLEALQARQLLILERAAALVRPGGRLIYATCSLLREENEDVVGRFLSSQPQFRQQGEPLKLLPQREGTDGFYAARLRRNI